MEEKERKELEELIKEGEKQSDNIKYIDSYTLEGIFGVFGDEYRIINKDEYYQWLEECLYWININNNSFKDKIKAHYDILMNDREIKSNEHQKLLSSLKAMLKYPQKKRPTMNENKKESQPANVFNINQSQNQSQEQSQEQKILQEIFIEAIKDGLTGIQQKELRAILEEHKDDVEKAKPKLVNKILSFGKDVASNILANILTNPNLIGLF